MIQTDSNRPAHPSSDILPVYTPVFSFLLEKADFILSREQTVPVIAPSGQVIRKIWLTGTLTSYEPCRMGGIIRIADPTGAVSCIIKPQALDSLRLEDLIPPLFLSITAFPEQKRGQDGNEIQWQAETCRIVTRSDRDTWILAAARELLESLRKMYASWVSGDDQGIFRNVQKHYHIQPEDLKHFAEQAEKALAVMKDPGPPIEPAQFILSVIQEYSGPKGIHIDDIQKYTRRAALADDLVRETIRHLIAEDEVYQPAPGYIKLL
ncbi:MAG TPA: hypothetical protein PK024_07980 [Methanospirillum sp.]|uniref:hypothetical protein n=1 Tax=Methanospirillum sp. TaxID=45200 RepID=UPI002C4F5564|nr:hypothetical protein [Methanospirillum sp.]HOJ96755.1 hypothetical protein [Methanospirillum sp.]HPP76777.1 hypothetical protein [Methanospirillum sp.]